MSLELLRYPSYAWFALLAAAMVCMAIAFILHFFVPKEMLRTYFREPYFSPAEIEFFTGFPFAYMRTAMFMRLAGWPSSGSKRGLTEAYKLAPAWFQILSRVFIRIYLTIVILLFVLGGVLYFMFWMLGY